jgi:hypothetical protein
MLNSAYLQQGLDFRLAHKDGPVEGGAQAPQACDGLVVLRVRAREPTRRDCRRLRMTIFRRMKLVPRRVKDSILDRAVAGGASAPATTSTWARSTASWSIWMLTR